MQAGRTGKRGDLSESTEGALFSARKWIRPSDIALQNIVIKPDLSLKLIDLGRAKNLSTEAKATRELIFAREKEALWEELLKIDCSIVDDTGAVLSQKPKKLRSL